MTRFTTLPAILCVLLFAPLSTAADGSGPLSVGDLAGLPPVPTASELDWLVTRPAHVSGVFRGESPGELVLDNGLVRRAFLLSPNLATVELRQLVSGESILRAVGPEAILLVDAQRVEIGGLRGQAVGNYLLRSSYAELETNADAFRLESFDHGPIRERFPWRPRREWMSADAEWPPRGVHLRFHLRAPEAAPASLAGLRVTVHHEIYDGLPLLAKWVTVENRGEAAVRLNRFTSERLACVEGSSEVEDIVRPVLPNLHVETDFTSVAMTGLSSQRDVVHWREDPSYTTQVNYLLKTRCLLECEPPLGPAIDLAPGETFETFRTWILAYDDRDATRSSLALSRMYRTIAPWVLENPLIHHVRSAKPDAVKLAIEQCAGVGFELVIMTFGSGFQIENESPEYLAQIRALADHAHERGIALGGYSLLASRSVSAADDVVNPATGQPGGFARFGQSPCLESPWGQDYFRKLEAFFEKTGCDVLEHDGSYPGDACASTSHPGHRGHADSRWRQWQRVTGFYRWCRGRGIYLNVPDWYFLQGSSKTGMGYRETNWSLPRAHQEIVERQNIHDGTRFKSPTMGWMFVPLTQYHGGGAAATIEPLDAHRDHYERRLANLLGAGVQACFRGPRLYDTDATRAVVKRWVDFYRRYRAILDREIIPLRRPDGRDWDGLLHVAPDLPPSEPCALAMLYNPLDEPITRRVRIPLYFSGLSESARVEIAAAEAREISLDRQERATLEVTLPARGSLSLVFRRP